MHKRTLISAAILAASTLAALAPSLASQSSAGTTAAGYAIARIHSEQGNPLGVRGFAIDRLRSELYVAIDNILERYDAQGQRSIARTLPAGHSFGLLEAPEGQVDLFYSDFSTNTLYRLDIAKGTETQRNLPANSFDLALAPSGEVLVTANPKWPNQGAQAGVWLLPAQGAAREIIALDGPSGPLTFTSSGDLICARISYAVPAPPGSISLLRFSSSKIKSTLSSAAKLGLADVQATLSGLDGCYDLAKDDTGRIYWTDPTRGGVQRSLRGSFQVDPSPLLQATGKSSLGLMFHSKAAATFGPYQPDQGQTLYLATSDWMTSSDVLGILPMRPRLSASTGPIAQPGPVTMHFDGLPANQRVWLLANWVPPVPETVLFNFDGMPMWLSLNLGVPPFDASAKSDAKGQAAFLLNWPGGSNLTLTFQGIAQLNTSQLVTSKHYVLKLKP